MPASSDRTSPPTEQLRLTRPYLGRFATLMGAFGGLVGVVAVIASVAFGSWPRVVVGMALLVALAVLLVEIWSRVVELGPDRIGYGSALRTTHWMAVEDVRLVVPVAFGHPMFRLRRGLLLLGTAGGAGPAAKRQLLSTLTEEEQRQVAAAERANGPLGSLFVPVNELDEERRATLRAWMGRALPAPHAERALVMVDSGRR